MHDTGWMLVEIAVRAAGLGLAAGVFLWLGRRKTPSVRHAVWVGVVLGMLALPLLTATAPRLPVGWLGLAPGTPVPAVDAPLPVATTLAESVERAAAPLADAGLSTVPVKVGWMGVGDLPWAGLLVGLYFGVAALLLASLARGAVQLRRLAHTARPIDDPALRALADELSPERAVTLLSSPAVRVPLTAGFLRPRVFLPASWPGWSADKRCAVLAHELSHVRRGDFLWTLLAELNICLYWFHPLAWVARRQLAAVAEQASDAAAVARLGSKTAYASILVEIAARLQQRRRVALPSVPMASANGLARRVEQILRLPSAGPHLGRRLPAVAALALLALFAGTVELGAEPDVSEPPLADFDARIAELGHPDPDRRARAAYQLALDESRWDDAIPYLVALLGDDAEIRADPPRRRSLGPGDRWMPAHVTWESPSPGEVAVVSLASMSTRATEPLIEALTDGDPVVRRNAAWGLGELRNRPGVPEHGEDALIAALGDADDSVRAAVAWSLGDIRVRRAIPGLIDTLREDPDPRVRAMAANALGEIRAADAEDLLAEVAGDDPDRKVRRMARRALSEVIDHGF